MAGSAPGGRLPWERDGLPEGVGIGLSRGGIRAAAFALGAVQTRQAWRVLFFGPRCADCLAVVSGGSYIGGSLTLNAAARAAMPGPLVGPAPFAEGSPEADHVLANGTYLSHGGRLRTSVRFFVVVFLTAPARTGNPRRSP